MAAKLRTCLLTLVFLAGISGCYVNPVRHLASDAALIKVGVSTREEVLVFLGEPDEQKEVGEGMEKWLYREKKMSLMEKTPLIGKHVGSPEYHRVVVTLRNGIAVDCVYSSSDEDEMDWAKDYSWQKNQQR